MAFQTTFVALTKGSDMDPGVVEQTAKWVSDLPFFLVQDDSRLKNLANFEAIDNLPAVRDAYYR